MLKWPVALIHVRTWEPIPSGGFEMIWQVLIFLWVSRWIYGRFQTLPGSWYLNKLTNIQYWTYYGAWVNAECWRTWLGIWTWRHCDSIIILVFKLIIRIAITSSISKWIIILNHARGQTSGFILQLIVVSKCSSLSFGEAISIWNRHSLWHQPDLRVF